MNDQGTVHVIDDDASWRTSVQRLLEAAGYQVALYESAERFLENPSLDSPGCILLDVRMPGLTGPQLQERLAQGPQRLPILFLSGYADIPLTVRVVKAGADDLLTKPVETATLLSAVAAALMRDAETRTGQARLDQLRARLDSLTPTERRVFDLIVRGHLNKQVGAELGMAERTVKWHRHNMLPKLQVQSLAGMVSLAEHLGLLGADARGDTPAG